MEFLFVMAGEVKGAALTLRVTETMRLELQRSAAANGRSVSQEVERRISNSFLSDPNLGGDTQAALLGDVAVLMDATSMSLGRPWFEVHAGWYLVKKAWTHLLSLIEPEPNPDFIAQVSPKGRCEISKWEAETDQKTLNGIRNARELEQLKLKEGAFMLESEEQYLKEILEELPPPERSIYPSLGQRDLQLWHASEEQKILRRRIWRRAEPILQQAKRRFSSDAEGWEE